MTKSRACEILRRSLRSTMRDTRGGIAVTFSLALVPLLGCVALAVDVSTWYAARTKLQSVVDGAAIASAQELRIGRATQAQVTDAAQRYADSALQGGSSHLQSVEVSARISEQGNEVSVTIASALSPVFSRIITSRIFNVSVGATARVSGTIPVCMIATHPNAEGALSLDDDAELSAEGCGIYSNSSDQEGIVFSGSSTMSAERICSSGGYERGRSIVKPQPEEDCPSVGDPLAHRAAPSGCSHSRASNRIFKVRGNKTLSPGRYCDGIDIASSGTTTFNPGVYVVGGAGLIVSGGARIVGNNVSIAFKGVDSTFSFGRDTSINLSAPVGGPLAGILFIEYANAPPNRDFTISSNNARRLLGTIYLPQGNLVIDSETPVGGDSAYTVIVARKISLENGPRLILNTDYSATDVPVPEGVGLNGTIHLSQ